MRIIRKENDLHQLLARYAKPEGRLLNVGSKNVRITPNSVNLDLYPGPEVDVIGDAHDLPFDDESFDIVVQYALLQMVEDPPRVVREAHRVLRPGGTIFVDVPFIQPFAPEVASVDKWRFTHHGLRTLFEKHFDILESGVSIAAGSALATVIRSIADTWFRNRYVSFLLRKTAEVAVQPISFVRFGRRDETAGAFYLVGRKR